MPEQSLRFSVRDEDGNRAATWKLFTTMGRGKQDVYLVCRSLGSALKASLHESGSWHIGFDRGYVEENLAADDLKREDPCLDRWPRPTEINPGVTLAYRIVVPTSGVTMPIDEMLPESIIWIPAAPTGKAVELDVLFTKPDAVISSWPGCGSMGTELVGSFTLDNGETVWVVHHVVDIPGFILPSTGKMTWFKGKGAEDLSGGSVRAILFYDAVGGSRFMVDCAVHGGEQAI